MIDDKLYLLDTDAGTATPVFDFATIAKGGWPQLMRMTADGKRLFVSMNTAGKVAMFDTADPAKPRLLKALDLGKDSGPHYIALSKDGRRLVITDRRVLVTSGTLSRRVSSVPLHTLDDLYIHLSGAGRILRYGCVIVTAGGRRGPLLGFRRMPDPDLVFALLLGLEDEHGYEPEPPRMRRRHALSSI